MDDTALRSGLLLLDKPRGPTSHDAVSRVRRVLGIRSVGHAGTLDPMASGVLLMLIGQCTKLSRFLALEHKSYRAVVRLGVGTDTLDAEGKVVAEAEVPAALRQELVQVHLGKGPSGSLLRALERERARTAQQPPAHSAIKQNGSPVYKRARRGEPVELPDRDVSVSDLEAVAASAEACELTVEMSVSKGYYVRSLARDLGEALGIPAHLVELRRTRIGPYALADAIALDGLSRDTARILGLSEVARAAMPTVILTEYGVKKALWGQRMSDEDFETPPSDQVCAWLDRSGELVAVGERSEGLPTVLRAFTHPEVVC
ncbi:MAG: tRNA pseudouridine(55) synthase TruB [Deltaproteobacteria bacterium]|nr:tRNA pseudouridine(55) synthase TruB [Deltaproteobacteria bacterium]